MKTIVCGPAHSGKSVFIANLIYRLPSDSSTTIRACPDGEGTWSNNKNQQEVSNVRKKGKFTKEFIENSCKAIDNQTSDIVLVDVGGVMTKENRKIFRHCDNFIVLSSNEKLKQKWLRYGQYLGLECIGCIDSALEGKEKIYSREPYLQGKIVQYLGLECIGCIDSALEGKEKIYSREPYLQGKIVGLERGEKLENSELLKTIVSDIVEKSKQEKTKKTETQSFNGVIIENMELATKIGNVTETLTEQGNVIKHTEWSPSHIPQVYKIINKEINSKDEVRIQGIRPNFLITAICKACQKQGVKKISAFDIRSNQYIPIRQLPKKRGIKIKNGLSYNVILQEQNLYIQYILTLNIDLLQDNYTLEDYSKCILPQINERKNLYLSGRLPNWLIASITNSYNSNRIYTFQPGRGFSCVSSIDERDLGTVVDGITGIDINKFYEDQKKARESHLPVVPEKQGILSKLKQFFSKPSNKYLDENIVAKTISEPSKRESQKQSFRKDLEPNIIGPKDTQNIEEKKERKGQSKNENGR